MKKSIAVLLTLLAFTLSFTPTARGQGFVGAGQVKGYGTGFANQIAVWDSTGTLSSVPNAAISSGTAGPATVYTTSVTLTNAEMLALHTTPDTLIRAQGAGNAVINLISAYATMNYGSAAFASDSVLEITAGIPQNVIAAETGVIKQASNATGSFGLSGGSMFFNGGTGYPPNAPLLITTKNANPTSGTGSTVTVVLTYTVLNVSTGSGK